MNSPTSRLWAVGALLCGLGGQSLAGPLSISRVSLLPDMPTPYALRDWGATARAYDATVFDYQAKGQHLPLIWEVPKVPNITGPGFGMPSYVGNKEGRGMPGEAICHLGAILGATAAGIDKTRWVKMTPQFLNTQERLILNNAGGASGSSFWYELLPSLDFVQISSQYPNWSRGRQISRGIADEWLVRTKNLGGNFDHLSYDPGLKKGKDNGLWKEPESAAAVAYLQLMEGLRSGETKYLAGSRAALQSLQTRDTNPTYEVLTPYGALTAAYLNAEKGDRWDVPRFVNWCFDPNAPYRTGWGMIAGRWGAYDVGGLMGSTNDGGGYAFAMNTYLSMATLAPVARYDSRYSASMAKWILNASNASRLFFRDSLPAKHQSSSAWKGDKGNGLSYEGLRRSWEGVSPYATGDAKRSDWAKEDLGLYGGGYVGLLSALIKPTNIQGILQINLLATDFLPTKAYPTSLYWNPHTVVKKVWVTLPRISDRAYDAVSHRFISLRGTGKRRQLVLAPKQAVQLVQVPGAGRLAYSKNKTLLDGKVIDYNTRRSPLPSFTKKLRADRSQAVLVPQVVGRTPDWSKGESVSLSSGEGSPMRANLQFAWDKDNLHFRVTQTGPATESLEAKSAAQLAKNWWDFECVALSFDGGRDLYPVITVPELCLGWSSTGIKNLGFTNDLAGFQSVTKGDGSSREIVGFIPWKSLSRAFGRAVTPSLLARPGTKMACQPLLVDGTFKRQAYIGGARYARPDGFDANSRTLILKGM